MVLDEQVYFTRLYYLIIGVYQFHDKLPALWVTKEESRKCSNSRVLQLSAFEIERRSAESCSQIKAHFKFLGFDVIEKGQISWSIKSTEAKCELPLFLYS